MKKLIHEIHIGTHNKNAKLHYSSRYIMVILCFVFGLMLTACGNDDKSEVQLEDRTTPVPTSAHAAENSNNEGFQSNDDSGLVESNRRDPNDQEIETEYNSVSRDEIDFSISQEFSLSSSNNTPPEDVLYEVSWAGGFGGDGPRNICTQSYEHPEVIFVDNFGAEDLNHSGVLEWMEHFKMTVCGWHAGEEIQVIIQSESGEIIYKGVIDSDEYFNYQVPINTPYGLYSVIFEGEQNGKVTQSLAIEKPTEPRIYGYENGLLLYNFKPNERIRLLGFSGDEFCTDDFTLSHWQEYQINDQGYLIIQLANDIPSVCAFVVSNQSEILVQPHPYLYAKMTPRLQADTSLTPTPDNIMGILGVIGVSSDLPVINRLEVREDFVYAITEESTLLVIDVSDPTNPLKMGSTENSDYARSTSIKVIDGFAYVTYGNLVAGLIIIDISDPYNPHEVGRFENDEFMSGNYATGIAIHSNFAFISHWDTGLWVIDISDSSNPIQVASGNFSGDADDIVIRDTFAFLAMQQGELKIVDISLPTRPNEISSLMLPDYASREIEIVGDYLYISGNSRNTDGGIHIIDISSPYSPTWVNYYSLSKINKIVATQALVFLGTQNGLRVLSVSDPTNPDEIAEYNEFDNINAIFVRDDLLFLAVNDDQQGKLIVLTLSQNFVNEN